MSSHCSESHIGMYGLVTQTDLCNLNFLFPFFLLEMDIPPRAEGVRKVCYDMYAFFF